MKRSLKFLVLVLFLVLLVPTGISYYVAYQIVHHRSSLESNPQDFGLSYEEVVFKSTDGVEIVGWLIKGDRDATIIVCHGLSSNKERVLKYVKFLNEAGYSVFTFDFRGHGESSVEKTTAGPDEVKDLLGAVEYLKGREDVSDKIGVLGFSMGAAISMMAAAQSNDILAVVEDSGYATFERAIDWGFSTFTGLPNFPFKPITVFFGELQINVDFEDIAPLEYVSKISPRPILFIHGTQDKIVNPEDVHLLYNKALNPKFLWIAEDAEHTQAYELYPEEYEKRILEFFDQWLSG